MRTCSGISIAYAQGHCIILGGYAWVWSSIIIVDEWVNELILWTTSNRCLTVSSIKRNINNVCWVEQEGTITPSGEKPGTLVRQSIHRLKPLQMSKGVRNLRCNPKVLLPKETH